MRKICMLAAIVLTFTNNAYAAESTINFSGKLVKGACLINDGQAIDVDFGDITGNISSLNSGDLNTRFQKEITYTVSCNGGIQNNAMKIMLNGSTAASSSANVAKTTLATSKEDLGIMLTSTPNGYTGDDAIVLGEWKEFEYPNLMKIYATPIRLTSGIILGSVSGGTFTASATMQVEYQ